MEQKLILVKINDILEIRNHEAKVLATVTDVKRIRSFQNGYMAVEFITKRDCDTNKPCEFRWGFIDTNGNIVVEPKYIYVSNVNNEGCAYVEIGESGGQVIEVKK